MFWNMFASHRNRKTTARKPARKAFRPALEMLEDRRLMATIGWTSLGDGNFHDAGNWTTSGAVPEEHRVPGPGDVAIATGITVTITNNVDVAGLIASAKFVSVVSGTTIRIGSDPLSGDSSLGGLVLQDGTLEATGNLTIGALESSFVNATLRASGSATLSLGGGLENWVYTNTLLNPATATSAIRFQGGTHVFDGSDSVSGLGTLELDGAATVRVAAGTLPVNTNVLVDAGIIEGPGNFQTGPGTTFTWLNGAMQGGGATIIDSQAQFNIVGDGGKSITNRTLELNGLTTVRGGFGFGDAASVLNNRGTFDIQIDSDVGYSNGLGGQLNNSGTLRKSSGADVSDLRELAVNLQQGGSVDIQSGALRAYVGGSASGNYTLQAGALELVGGTFTFLNNSHGTGPGTFQISGAGIGFVPAGANATLTHLALRPHINGHGALEGPGTLTVGTLDWMSGTLQGGIPGQLGTLTVTGATTISSDLPKAIYDVILNLQGPTTYSSATNGVGDSSAGNVLGAGAVINNSNTFTLQVDFGFIYGSGSDSGISSGPPIQFNNTGTLRKTAGPGPAYWSWTALNALPGSTVDIQSGRLQLGAGGSATGNYTLQGTVELRTDGGGPFTLNNSTGSGTGTLEISSGNVIVPAGVSATLPNLALSLATSSVPVLEGAGSLTTGSLTWTDGTIQGGGPGQPGTLTVTGAATINGASSNRLFKERALNLQGPTRYSATTNVPVDNGAVINNTGTFDLQTPAGFVWSGFGATPLQFNNLGTFRKSAGDVADWSWAQMTNDGTVAIEVGTLKLAPGDYTQTAGTTIVQAGTTFDPEGVVRILGGTLRGNGAIAADVVNAGAVSPGLSAGTLTINGTYTQTATGALNLELGGALEGQFDRLNVTGSATLAGTLNVGVLNSFVPLIDQSFAVLTFASRTGDFTTTTGLILPSGGVLVPGYNAANFTLTAGPIADTTTSHGGPLTLDLSPSATYQVRSAGTEAWFANQDLDLTYVSYNDFGTGEEWFHGIDNQFGNPWYLLKESGELLAWNGTGAVAGHTLYNLDTLYWWYPALLANASPADLAHAIDHYLELRTDNGNLYENFSGLGERWLVGLGGYCYLTPDGGFYTGGGTRLTTLDPIYYSQPARLYDALPGQITAAVEPGAPPRLVITPINDFVGQLVIELSTFTGGTAPSNVERFTVSVANRLPTLGAIADQTMPTSQDTLTVPVTAGDLDAGDTVALTVQAGHIGFKIQSDYGFSAVDPFPYFGLGERWLRGNVHGTTGSPWYYIQPNGQLFAWNPAGANVLLTTLDPIYHAFPGLLVKSTATDLAAALRSHAVPFWDNSLGLNERWLNDGATGLWYYLRPNGQLFYENGTLVSSPGASLYTNLPAGSAALFTATISGANVVIDPVAGFTGDIWVLVEASDVSPANRRRAFQFFRVTVTS